MPALADTGLDARDASADAGEDAGDDAAADANTDAGEEDASVDVAPDTFDAGPLTCPGPGGALNDPIVLYTFQAPDSMAMITDRAPSGPDVPLIDNTGVFTVDNGGAGSAVFTNGQAAADQAASDALVDAIIGAGGFAVEVWFTDDNLILEETSPPERIVTLSLDSVERAFTIGQDLDELVGRFRSTTTWPNGIYCDEPVVGDAFPPAGVRAVPGVFDGAPPPTHVVLSFDGGEGRPRLFVDGVEAGGAWPCRTGALGWVTGLYRLALGNEFDADRAWEGTIHRVAIYARPMSLAEVACWAGAGADADVFL